MSSSNAKKNGSDLAVKAGSDEQIEVGAPHTYGSDPGALAPRYIQACHSQSWKMGTWSKSDPSQPVKWRTVRCCSWRHEGPCQEWKAAQDYARIKRALEERDRESVVYLVLTIDPSAWTGAGWAGYDGETPERRADAVKDGNAISAAYDALGDRWSVLSKALRRRFGKFEYVSTVESHRSGWPHLNVVIVSSELARFCEVAESALTGWEKDSRGREAARRILGEMLERSGFGRIAFIERAHRRGDEGDSLAAYIAKLASSSNAVWDGESRGLFTGEKITSLEGRAIAEVAKHSQVPHRTPKNFRRLRSSKGFLPKMEKDPDVTGGIFDAEGKPIGKLVCDDILEDARSCTPEADKTRILARIGEELVKLDMRDEWQNDHENIVLKKRRRIIRTLIHAAKIASGEDVDAWRRDELEFEAKLWAWEEKRRIAAIKRRNNQWREELKLMMRAKGIAV